MVGDTSLLFFALRAASADSSRHSPQRLFPSQPMRYGTLLKNYAPESAYYEALFWGGMQGNLVDLQ
jgi:hypothetical protein